MTGCVHTWMQTKMGKMLLNWNENEFQTKPLNCTQFHFAIINRPKINDADRIFSIFQKSIVGFILFFKLCQIDDSGEKQRLP